MRTARRLILGVIFALLALHSIEPTGAFTLAQLQGRAVSASVVTDSAAYMAVTGGTCSVPTAGGSCSFTITNKATTSVTFTVTKTADAASRISKYGFGATTTTTGAITTDTSITPGNSATLTATVRSCISCVGDVRQVYWTVEADNNNVFEAERTRYLMTITYT